MKTTLIVLIGIVMIFTFGCATPRSYSYQTDTTWPEGVAGDIAKHEQVGWEFVSMSAASKADNGIAVVLLFRKHK